MVTYKVLHKNTELAHVIEIGDAQFIQSVLDNLGYKTKIKTTRIAYYCWPSGASPELVELLRDVVSDDPYYQ